MPGGRWCCATAPATSSPAALSTSPAPTAGGPARGSLGDISRVSEFRRLDIHKIKGTLVNFNALEHALDDADEIEAWQVEIRKRHDDPYECDELHLLVTPRAGRERAEIERTLSRRFRKATETSPNAIHLLPVDEMRDRLGVGRLLKEEKIVDRRVDAGSGGEVSGSGLRDAGSENAEPVFSDQ